MEKVSSVESNFGLVTTILPNRVCFFICWYSSTPFRSYRGKWEVLNIAKNLFKIVCIKHHWQKCVCVYHINSLIGIDIHNVVHKNEIHHLHVLHIIMLAENKNSSFDSCSSARGSIFTPARSIHTYHHRRYRHPVRLFALSMATSLHSWHKRGYIIQYQTQYIHERR